jgi:hypothetical protein
MEQEKPFELGSDASELAEPRAGEDVTIPWKRF